jgi:alginate O-acetyltransferase complex protein AlgI
VVLMVIGFMEIIHLTQRKRDMRMMLVDKPIWVRWAFYYALTFSIIFLGVFTKRQFIYFQF